MHNSVTAVIQEAADYPFMFLLLVLLFFAITMLVIGVIAYAVLYVTTRKTELNGVMKVGLTLNEWNQPRTETELLNLSFGEFLIPMHDPEKIRKNRLDPKLGLFARVKCRKYSIGTLLARYCTQFEESGFYGDAGWNLLQELLKNTDFCEDLGVVYQDLRKKTLNGFGCAVYAKDPKNSSRLRVFADVPRTAALQYQGETECTIENLCLTMEYCSPAEKK